MNIDTLKTKMLVKYPFFGRVIANMKYVEEPRVDTLGTDGETIFYNPEYLFEKTESEQVFLLAHEVCHVAFDHILRSEGKNQKLWNIATDAVINQFLKRDGLSMPKDGIDIEDALNYDAEELYEKLLKEAKKQEQQQQTVTQMVSMGGQSDGQQDENNQQSSGGSSGSNDQNDDKESSGGGSGNDQNDNEEKEENDSSGGSGNGEEENEKDENQVGHDSHGLWEDAVKKHHEEEQQKENENNNGQKNGGQNENKQKQDKISEREMFEKNKQEKKRQLENMYSSIANDATGKTAGNDSDGNYRNVGTIGKARPLIDWRLLLKEAVTYDADWSFKNMTIEDGVVTPHLEELPFPETEILLDTSGSINEELLKNFLHECKNILEQSKVKVGCFDTEFYGFQEIRDEYEIDNMKFQGGGGTDFDVAVNAFTNRVDNKIIFTDGWASMPIKPVDAIWVVFGDIKIDPPGGKVIYITGKDLDRLQRRGRSYN